ncbi:hypothetical protein O181_002066 [Austropuccinia psidii MF-1]|uniref:Nucleolar 27S pre-rRNA processing Urb2/Npa2 C-terminal domain-containing protein n=1 Tax=Austropuccinia psidii MF-1 TaxID=1389203 RepID=A0A9Q3BCA9_9BASI|nr:hypothetical protein [Austropuccinia psidii MF-1]
MLLPEVLRMPKQTLRVSIGIQLRKDIIERIFGAPEESEKMTASPLQSKICDGPEELFLALRSSNYAIEERILLAQTHWSSPSFTLGHKDIYFLKWMLEPDLHDPKRKRKSDDPLTSPAHLEIFWAFLHQLIIKVESQDLVNLISVSGFLPLARATISGWSNLSKNPEAFSNTLSSLQTLWPLLCQRLSFELSVELFHGFLQSLIQETAPVAGQIEEMALLILKGLLSIIQQPSNYRKALNAILKQNLLILQLKISLKLTFGSTLGVLILRMMYDLIFNVENVKKLLHAGDGQLDWLDSFRIASQADDETTLAVFEILPHFLQIFAREWPRFQSQLSNSSRSHNGSQFALGRTPTTPLAHFHASRTLALNIFSSSHKLIKALGSAGSIELNSRSVEKFKVIVGLIMDCNIYEPTEAVHHEILDSIAHDCISYLADESISTVSHAWEVLVYLLKMDYDLIGHRLDSILPHLVGPSPSEVLINPVLIFLNTLFDWYSKAKQLPVLLTKFIDTIESRLGQFSLDAITNGPLMSRIISERSHEEIRLSMSYTQMSLMHDSLSHRLLNGLLRARIQPEGHISERSSKRRKLSAIESSPAAKPEDLIVQTPKPSVENRDFCIVLSFFYDIFAIAASRSSLQSKERSDLSAKLSSFGSQIIKTIIQPTLEQWPPRKGKNRFRKWTNFIEQSILASAFRTLTSIFRSQSRQLSPEIEVSLTEWLEFFPLIFEVKKQRVNPELITELMRLCLEFTSYKLFLMKSIDLTIPHAVYNALFLLIENLADSPECSLWSGRIAPITFADCPCAIWHYLTTLHLSEFTTLATPTQLSKFAEILVNSCAQTDKTYQTKSFDISIADITQDCLSAPAFHEAYRLREPMMKQLIKAFDCILPLSEDANNTSFQLSIQQLKKANQLYCIISVFPLSYLTKSIRKFLLSWTLLWNKVLSIQRASKSEGKHSFVSRCHSRSSLCKLLQDSNYSIKCAALKEATNLAVLCLAEGSHGHQGDKNLDEMTQTMLTAIIAHLFKNAKTGKRSDVELLSPLFSALVLRVEAMAQVFDFSGGVRSEDQMLFASLQALADHAQSSFAATLQICTQVLLPQPLHDIIEPLLQSLQRIFKNFHSQQKVVPGVGLLKLYKVYLQLRRITEPEKFENTKFPIDLTPFLPILHGENKRENQSSVLSLTALQVAPQEVLEVFEEMIQIQRCQFLPLPRSCVNAFQILVMSHIRFRMEKSSLISDEAHRSSMRRLLIQSCKNSTEKEFESALTMVLDESSRAFESCRLKSIGQENSIRGYILIDVAVTMALNGPTSLASEAKKFEEDCVLKLFKYIRLLSECPDDNSDSKIKFLFWKTSLIDQICIHKMYRINRHCMLEILETLTELSFLPFSQTHQSLHEQLVAITLRLNHEHCHRSLTAMFPLLLSLFAQLLAPSLDLTAYSRLLADFSSTSALNGAFSKHAPFFLIRLMSNLPKHRTPTLEYGLTSLVNTLGKFERSSVGSMIHENPNQFDVYEYDVQMIWRKTLKAWETSRWRRRSERHLRVPLTSSALRSTVGFRHSVCFPIERSMPGLVEIAKGGLGLGALRELPSQNFMMLIQLW